MNVETAETVEISFWKNCPADARRQTHRIKGMDLFCCADCPVAPHQMMNFFLLCLLSSGAALKGLMLSVVLNVQSLLRR